MKIVSKQVKEKVSFRGFGFVEIGGLLVPVCGSRFFDLSAGLMVRYLRDQIELSSPEPEIKAVALVRVVFNSPNSVIRLTDGVSATGRIIMEEGYEEGIPKGIDFQNGFLDTYTIRAPFRLRMPETIRTDDGNNVRGWDTVTPGFTPTEFDNGMGGTFFTELFIP